MRTAHAISNWTCLLGRMQGRPYLGASTWQGTVSFGGAVGTSIYPTTPCPPPTASFLARLGPYSATASIPSSATMQ